MFQIFAFLLVFSFIKPNASIATLTSAMPFQDITTLVNGKCEIYAPDIPCSGQKMMNCFSNIFADQICFQSVFQDFGKNAIDYLSNNYNLQTFLREFSACSVPKIQRMFYESKNSVFLYSRNLNENYKEVDSQAVYPKCIKILYECSIMESCEISRPFHIVEKVIRICTHETFQTLNMSLVIDFATAKPIAESHIDELEILSTTKIGQVEIDQEESEDPILAESLDIFGNLTYDDVEYVKRFAMDFPKLEKYLCDLKIEFSKELEIPEEMKIRFNQFSIEQYTAIKAIIKHSKHFRYFICSSIFYSSALKNSSRYSKNGTIWWTPSPPPLPTSDSYRLIDDGSSKRVVQPKEPFVSNPQTIANEYMCRNIADINEFYHSSICGCRKGKY